MRRAWSRAGAVTMALAAAWPAFGLLADDDVSGAAPRPAPVGQPGIDLAAHVDINVVLPTDHWRVAGGLQNVIIGGGGRLVLEGNLTIGGEPVAAAPERVRRTDEAVLARLRRAQHDRLAAIAADPGIPAARRRSLQLATEVDIRRVTAEVARLRDRYAGRRAQLGDDSWRRFQQDVQACRRSIADPFDDDSLFAAVRAEFAAADD